MRDRVARFLKNTLLAFVLISIGFALGKEVTVRRQSETSAKAESNSEPTTRNSELKVIVYYAHTTFRCVTCNTIEELAEQTLKTRFADGLAAGRVEWRTVNFQEDEAFASRYEIVASTVVVVGMQGDKETGYRRLDEVWAKVNNPAEFELYVAGAVRERLEKLE